jgi:hypothetical protein
MAWNKHKFSLNMKKQLILSTFLALVPILGLGQSQVIDTNKARMDALFQEMHDVATWGLPTTNGIQLGVAIFNGDGVIQFHGVKQFRVFTYLYDETNSWFGLYPPSGYRLSLSLKGAGGSEVEKTKEGKAISKPVGLLAREQMKLRAERMQGRFDLLATKYPDRYEAPFKLLDCFMVEKPGTNTLTVGATLYKMSNDGGIYEIALPPVSIQVSVTKDDLDRYKASKDAR